jgi:hypothetical protein
MRKELCKTSPKTSPQERYAAAGTFYSLLLWRRVGVEVFLKLIKTKTVFLLLLIVNYSLIIAKAQNSVLSKGEFYKIAVTQTGVHKIDANFLKKTGIDISTINPQNIKIYGNGGAILPQANAAIRPKDLTENAIYVEGEADGKFDSQDYILFYGESSHVVNYDSTNKKFTHQINIYSDSTFYFLAIADTKGLRIKNQNSISATKTIDTFDDFIFHEVELKNINNSGRTWYGEYFGSSGEHSFDVKIDGIVSKSPIKISSSAMSIAQVNSTMQVKLNNELLGTHEFNFIYPDKYAIKGNENYQTFSTNSDGNAALKVTYTYDGKKETSSGAYLDYFEIQTKRKSQFYDKQTLVRSIESLANTSTNFQIAQVQNDSKIWEVTNPQNVANQTLQIAGNLANFAIETKGVLKTFILFSNNNLLEPNTIRKIENQNLKISQVPDLLIVTPKIWQAQAEKLANFRRKNDSLTVLVATTESIYNEFSSGNSDITSIRDFGRFLWLKNPQKFKYLLLFGDATFDYKNHINIQEVNANNFVPVYESRQSLHPINSFSSDDYVGFFQEKDGEWVEDYGNDHFLDIGVGRLPVKNIDEAEGVVEKMIFYANQKKTLGKWRGQISFVADDGDYNIHQRDAEALSKIATSKNQDLNINKIYVDAFSQVATPNGATAPTANKAIERAVNEGSLIINYNGHGGVIGWAEEKILNIGEIQDFKNIQNMPLFLTATCEFGQYDNPTLVSGAELAALNRRGAAIGLLTTTRPVY